MARTQGTVNLDDKKRAVILAKKNVQLSTHGVIARQEKVSRNTVVNITNEAVPPDVLELAKKYEKQFLAYAEANALKAMRRTYATIDDLTADKSAAVAEKMFNISQVSRNKPTAILQMQNERETANKLLTRALEAGAPREDAINYIISLMGVGREVFDE